MVVALAALPVAASMPATSAAITASGAELEQLVASIVEYLMVSRQ